MRQSRIPAAWLSMAALLGPLFFISPAISRAASELFSESVQVPVNDAFPLPIGGFRGWDEFDIGYTTGGILPTQNPYDPYTDPFAKDAYSSIQNGPPIEFTGSSPLPAPNPISASPAVLAAVTVQFGIVGPVDGAALRITGQTLVGTQGAPPGPPGTATPDFLLLVKQPVPAVSIVPLLTPAAAAVVATPSPTASMNYVTAIVQFSEGAYNGTEWAEFPFVPGMQPTFRLTGDPVDTSPIVYKGITFQVTKTEIPIDSLNAQGDPPPGITPSPVALPITIVATAPSAVPEPASLAVLGTAALALLARPRR